MKKQQVMILVGIAALIIVVALVSSGRLQLSPALSASSTSKCQLGPLTDCINGCWQTYLDRVKDITEASRDHRQLCCITDSNDMCGWDENRSECMDLKIPGPRQFCSEPDYWACLDQFDGASLLEQAKKDRDVCIKGCQGQFCSGGAINQQVQLSPSSELARNPYCGKGSTSACPDGVLVGSGCTPPTGGKCVRPLGSTACSCQGTKSAIEEALQQ